MCYGDVGHGRDGYYAKWLQDQEEDQARRAHEEEQHAREQQPVDL